MTRQQIKHALTSAIPTIVCAIALVLSFWVISATEARAQTDEQSEGEQMEQSFKKLSSGEEAKLRAIIAEPTSKDVTTLQLEIQIEDKVRAAQKLGDPVLKLAAYKEAVAVLSNAKYRNELANEYMNKGDIANGNLWREEAIKAAASDYQRTFYLSNLAKDQYNQNKDAEAKATIEKIEALVKNLRPKGEGQQRDVQRTLSNINFTRSLLEQRKGRFESAIKYAESAVQHARAATKLLGNSKRDLATVFTYGSLTNSLSRKLNAEMNAKKLALAETTLQDYLRVYREVDLPKSSQLSAINNASWLRFNQREFIAQEKLTRQVIAGYQGLNYEVTDPRIANVQNRLAISLFGQKKYGDALAIYSNFDHLAGNDAALKRRFLFRTDRARTYLLNDMATEAAPLFATEASNNAKFYGPHPSGAQHFFTAQAAGLHGVALWRINTPESKTQAYPLLQNSVRDYMTSENVDYLENIGIRKEVRELIFSTYLEAASQLNMNDAVAALGVADWLRGGLVQEALGDAAIRAAATNEALADLVRRDQDARNEVTGLRNYLGGETGGAASPLASVAAQMRERINFLEKTRASLQTQIKSKFPDYEKLVRPLPPSTAEIQARLKTSEALIVLQPTEDAVYVWSLNQNGTGQFHRSAVTNTQLTALVKRLRASLDVSGLPANRMPAFDHAAAQELYVRLLSPIQQGLAGKTSLIIAAGGTLGQIPFGVLETAAAPKTVAMKDAPWLIKQAAITHVPSVAAWLSMRALPHQTASQPMLAWGDPLFNLALASNAKSSIGEVRKINLTRAATAVDLEKEDAKSAIKYADIPALPETRDELLAIAKTLGADVSRDLILGSQATRESVLAQNKNGNLAKQRVVAFATHGLMAGDLPNLTQPALAMAGTKDDVQNVLSPLLTLEDVLTLKLNADWVVLSACNTAAADGKAEEALSGLARGFFYAGSRSLLVTHWAVDSGSAVTLTTETFKNYQSKPTEAKAESLRQAMLTVMKNPATAHPTFWAPYALVGDGAR